MAKLYKNADLIKEKINKSRFNTVTYPRREIMENVIFCPKLAFIFHLWGRCKITALLPQSGCKLCFYADDSRILPAKAD